MILREERIKTNIGLVHSCARKFKDRGIEYEDLFQAGCLGLIKAADGFDESVGCVFSTYAVPAILGEIKRLFRDGGAVKVSRGIKEKANLLRKEKDRIAEELGYEPTVKELSEKLGMSIFEVSELLLVYQPVISLTSDEEGTEDKQFDIPVEGEQTSLADRLTLIECISQLGEKDRLLIRLRYYESKTQSAVAGELGMTQVQVSRREKKILKEIREKMTV